MEMATTADYSSLDGAELRPHTSAAGKLESRARRLVVKKFLFLWVAVAVFCMRGFGEDHPALTTRVVVLGTGNPSADAER